MCFNNRFHIVYALQHSQAHLAVYFQPASFCCLRHDATHIHCEGCCSACALGAWSLRTHMPHIGASCHTQAGGRTELAPLPDCLDERRDFKQRAACTIMRLSPRHDSMSPDSAQRQWMNTSTAVWGLAPALAEVLRCGTRPQRFHPWLLGGSSAAPLPLPRSALALPRGRLLRPLHLRKARFGKPREDQARR